jgi:hypothetical protein
MGAASTVAARRTDRNFFIGVSFTEVMTRTYRHDNEWKVNRILKISNVRLRLDQSLKVYDQISSGKIAASKVEAARF